MELDTLVRDVLREHAADAPAADGLLAAVTARRRRPTRWIVSGLSAAAVVALAISLAALRGSAPHADRTPAATRSAGRTVATPPGYSRVAYHQFTVAVPEGLPVLTTPCVAPARYVLAEDPNLAYSCVSGGVEPGQQTLTVRLTSVDAASDEIPLAPTEIDGMAARIGFGSLNGYPGRAGEAVFPNDDLAVVVTAPDRPTIEQILTSVERGPDPNGCPGRFTAPDDPPASALIPGTPSAAVRCVYATHRLQASLPVHAAALAGLVHAIDGLPAGGTQPQPQPFETDLLRLSYPDGTVRTVLVELGDPTRYSDGNRDGYDDNNVVTDQLRAATS